MGAESAGLPSSARPLESDPSSSGGEEDKEGEEGAYLATRRRQRDGDRDGGNDCAAEGGAGGRLPARNAEEEEEGTMARPATRYGGSAPRASLNPRNPNLDEHPAAATAISLVDIIARRSRIG